MKNQVSILIIDDDPNAAQQVKKKFIESTFLNRISKTVITDNLFTNQNNSAETILKGKEVFDFVFLDLELINDGIFDDHCKVLDYIIPYVKENNEYSRVILVSRSGPNIRDSYSQFSCPKQKHFLPLVDKEIKMEWWHELLHKEFSLWNKQILSSLSYSSLSQFKEKVFSQDSNAFITNKGKNYSINTLFANIIEENIDYLGVYKYINSLPNLRIDAWNNKKTSTNIKYSLPIKDYYSELYSNPIWFKKISFWETTILTNVLEAIILLKYGKGLKNKYEAHLNNSVVRWRHNNKLGKDVKNAEIIDEFISRLTTRRLILFLYLLFDFHPNDIYHILKWRTIDYRLESLSEKTVSNPIRYSYFIEGMSFHENLDRRVRIYGKLYHNIVLPEDYKLFIHILNEIERKFPDIDFPETYSERKELLLFCANNLE